MKKLLSILVASLMVAMLFMPAFSAMGDAVLTDAPEDVAYDEPVDDDDFAGEAMDEQMNEDVDDRSEREMILDLLNEYASGEDGDTGEEIVEWFIGDPIPMLGAIASMENGELVLMLFGVYGDEENQNGGGDLTDAIEWVSRVPLNDSEQEVLRAIEANIENAQGY